MAAMMVLWMSQWSLRNQYCFVSWHRSGIENRSPFPISWWLKNNAWLFLEYSSFMFHASRLCSSCLYLLWNKTYFDDQRTFKENGEANHSFKRELTDLCFFSIHIHQDFHHLLQSSCDHLLCSIYFLDYFLQYSKRVSIKFCWQFWTQRIESIWVNAMNKLFHSHNSDNHWVWRHVPNFSSRTYLWHFCSNKWSRLLLFHHGKIHIYHIEL